MLTLLLCCSAATAQKTSFTHLTVEQGLSQNTVLAIGQDARGFIWLGTRYGLNRYDGSHFVGYKNDPGDSNSISDNYINAILFDAGTGLWIGTEKGLNRYNPEQNNFTRIALTGDKASTGYTINGITREKNGSIWMATSAGLYLLQNQVTNTFISANDLGFLRGSKRNILRVYRDSRNYLWVASSTGLIRVSGGNGQYSEKIFNYNSNDPGSISDDYIMSVTEDKLGHIWVGTINGLNLYNPETESFTHFLYDPSNTAGIINNNVRALLTTQSGSIWIGTQDGLSIMDPVSHRCVSYQYNAGDAKSLSQNSLHSLFEDANGSVWLGSFFAGVNIAYKYATDFTAWQHNYARSSISNNVVSSIVADENNNLWIGTEGGGLNYFDRITQKFTVYKNEPGSTGGLRSNLVKTVFIDKDKNIWVGTHGGGLNLFDPVKKTFRYFLGGENQGSKQSEVVALLEDSEGKFWIGKHAGISVFNRNGTVLSSAGYEPALSQLAKTNITSVTEDNNKNVWIGTLTGLFLFERKTQSLHSIPLQTKTGTANVNCIKEDSTGNIWLGLYYGGLALYNDKQKTFTVYSTADGLPNDNVLGILEDDQHNLWTSTSNGLSKFNPATKAFQNYTASDGLASNEFNYNSFFKTTQGEMFFGGTNGYTSFYPSSIEQNQYTAPLVFTGLKIFNTTASINDGQHILHKDISLTDKLVFGPRQNTFTLEFSLLNYIKSNKNRYAYKLDGAHNEWTEINNPSATFTNLSAGDYTLLVKGANNDGVWSDPVRMHITILPPFWKTGWAYLLYALLFATMVFFIARYFYLRALMVRDKELQQVKLNFFTNISHEIRTHLTLIMAPVERMQSENAGNNVLSEQLGHVKNNANRLLKLVSELMDFRKAETDHLKLYVETHDLVSFLNNIYHSFEELSVTKNIKLSFVHNANFINIPFDKEQLEKVIFNLLTNAFKFTQDGGNIRLQVYDENDIVKIHVIDNGRGIAPEYLDKVFTNFFQVADHTTQNTGYGIGLALSKTIVELHKGTLTAESKPSTASDEGKTCFTVTLQKGSHLHAEKDMQPGENDMDKHPVKESLPASIALSETIAESNEKNFTVLIVEDNAALRTIIKDSLQQQFNVITAADGLTGWDIGIEQIPDLIVSDVMMPGMDGFTLCSQLKTDERTSHIPVILLTAKSSQTDHVSGLNTGADVYLTKPFSTRVLELNVGNLLSSREKMRQKFSKEFILAPQNTIINSTQEQFLGKLIKIIDDHMDDPEFGVDMIAVKIAMSQSVLYKKVKALTGMPVNDFAKSIRLKKAAQLLQQKQYSIYDVSLIVGFNDRKYFSREFKKQFGVSPSEFAGGAAINGLQD